MAKEEKEGEDGVFCRALVCGWADWHNNPEFEMHVIAVAGPQPVKDGGWTLLDRWLGHPKASAALKTERLYDEAFESIQNCSEEFDSFGYDELKYEGFEKTSRDEKRIVAGFRENPHEPYFWERTYASLYVVVEVLYSDLAGINK